MIGKGTFKQLVSEARQMYLESKAYFRATEEEVDNKSGQGFLDMSGGVCVICKDREPNTAVLPCGHSRFCAECALLLHKGAAIQKGGPQEPTCPLCRCGITQVIQLK